MKGVTAVTRLAISGSPANLKALEGICEPGLAIARTFRSSLYSDGSQRRPTRTVEKKVLAFGHPVLPVQFPQFVTGVRTVESYPAIANFRRRRAQIPRFLTDLGCLWWNISDSSDRSILLLPYLAPVYDQSVDCVLSTLLEGSSYSRPL